MYFLIRTLLGAVLFLSSSDLCAKWTKNTFADSFAVADTSRINSLLKSARELTDRDVSSADSVVRLALSLSSDLEYDYGIALSQKQLGVIFRNQGRYDSAMVLFNTADSLFEELHLEAEQAYLLNEISILFANTGNLDKSRNLFQEALSKFKRLDDTKGQGQMHHNIAITYDIAGDLDSALYHYFRGYRLKLLASDSIGVANSLNNLSVVSLNMGRIDSAVFYAQSAYDSFKKMNHKRGMMNSYNQIGKIYEANNKVQRAIPYYLQSLDYAKNLGDLDAQVTKYEDILQAFRKVENYKAAIEYQDEYLQAYDSLQKQIFDESTAKQKADFELRRKDEEVSALKEQRNLVERTQYLLIIGLVILSAAMIIIIRERLKLSVLYDKLSRKNDEISQQAEELNAQNEELQKLNRVKDRIFTVISHDMRGPIHTMSGFLELMKEGQVDKEEMIELSSSAFKEISRTSDMLLNLLIWANSHLQQTVKVPERIDLSEVIAGVFQLYEITASQKNVLLKSDIANQTFVLAEKSSVQLILRNLIGNAIKFTPTGKGIRVFVDKSSDDFVRLHIQDEGVGMSEDVIKKIFSEEKVLF